MHVGTFVAIDQARKMTFGPNEKPMDLDEFMATHRIDNPSSVIGPFETIILDREDENARSIIANKDWTLLRWRARKMAVDFLADYTFGSGEIPAIK